MTYKELIDKYNSTGDCCCKCGQVLLTTGGPLGDFFVMDNDGRFYCTECDKEFEDGDERIFVLDEDEDEENLEDCTLSELLDKLSGILDQAYEFAEDEEERAYICNVENALHERLRQEGVL